MSLKNEAGLANAQASVSEVNSGVSRRTIVKGAAWSIPVIAAATALPTAAASTSASGVTISAECVSALPSTTLPTVPIQVSPAVEADVTLTLSGGYTFADGSTSQVVRTDSSGSYVLSGVKAPSGNDVPGVITASLPNGVQDTANLRTVGAFAYVTGLGDNGQKGDGTLGNTAVPVAPLLTERAVSALSTSFGSVGVVTETGHVWTWGYNGYGELGNGDKVRQLTPVQAVYEGTSTPITDVVSGSYNGQGEGVLIVKKSDGTWWGTGENQQNSFAQDAIAAPGGNVGTDRTQVGFVQLGTIIPGDHTFKFVSVSHEARFVYTLTDGTVWHSGQNPTGVMGDGTSGGFKYAQTLIGPGQPLTNIQKAVTSWDNNTMYLDGSGNLWASGTAGVGEFGPGYTNNNYAQRISNPDGKQVVELWPGAYCNFFAKTADGMIYAIGQGDTGELGIGSATNASTWTPITALNGLDIVQVSGNAEGTTFLASNGNAYYTGTRAYGTAGDGSFSGVITTPQLVPIGRPVSSIASSWRQTNVYVVSSNAVCV